MGDSVVRSAVRLIRSGRLGTSGPAAPAAAAPAVKTRRPRAERDPRLGGAGRRRLGAPASSHDRRGQRGFRQVRQPGRRRQPRARRSGRHVHRPLRRARERSYHRTQPARRRGLTSGCKARLKPGQQAIIVAGDGAYSFKGSGYVRGGIFDRIELAPGRAEHRFRDRNHTRLGDLAAEGAPDLREIALFVVPEEFTLDPTEPWQLQLLVQRNVGARDKAFLTFDLALHAARQVPAYRTAAPARRTPAQPPTAAPARAARRRRRACVGVAQ